MRTNTNPSAPLAAPCVVVALALFASGCIDTDLMDELNWWDPSTGGPAGPSPEAGTGGDGGGGGGDAPWTPDGWAPGAGAGDETPPWLVPPGSCAPTEQMLGDLCVSTGPYAVALRLWASEAVLATARVEGAELEARNALPALEQRLVVAPLEPDAIVTLVVEIEDAAGHVVSTPPLEARTAAAVSPVAITELLFDPLGPEPHQEFVEVFNYGGAPVSIDGWALADEGGQDVLVAPTPLEPGSFALVVPGGFVPGEGSDPPPAAGALLIRLPGSIGSAGLRNSLEVVTLFDETGAQVSRYPALDRPPRAGCSIERLSPIAPDGDPGNWASSPPGRPTPGAPRAGGE